MRRYLEKIAMQYGLMAQQIQSIDFDLLEKTINEYYAKAHDLSQHLLCADGDGGSERMYQG